MTEKGIPTRLIQVSESRLQFEGCQRDEERVNRRKFLPCVVTLVRIGRSASSDFAKGIVERGAPALDQSHYMGIAIEESRNSLAEGDIPVGSVIVRGGEIFGIGSNRANTRRNPTSRGETEAIWNTCPSSGAGTYPERCFMRRWNRPPCASGRWGMRGRYFGDGRKAQSTRRISA